MIGLKVGDIIISGKEIDDLFNHIFPNKDTYFQQNPILGLFAFYNSGWYTPDEQGILHRNTEYKYNEGESALVINNQGNFDFQPYGSFSEGWRLANDREQNTYLKESCEKRNKY